MKLHEAIHIPTEVRTGDLVFKLTDATEHAQATLDQYVVTEQLLEAFMDAAKLVRAAVEEHSSKAAFLTGSFGSGKSNFMGVFQLLLDGNPGALGKPELAPVVKEIGEWRGDKKFLTVPFHLIGATSLESAVFGGYVDYLQKTHPDASMPDVFADEPILENADALLDQMGEDKFFSALATDDTGGDGDGGWGDLGGWDRARYDEARAEPVGGANRRLLVQSLLSTLLSAFAAGAKANRDGYVDIDAGLAALSRHASELGYSGLILFLDELILWLMSRMADPAFVSAEASKISKLVEASEAGRPAPIISIIARQRDLRELVGSDVPGAERLSFIDQLNFQAGRFTDIRLNDSNLPVVAHHRLLKPANDAGAEALADAFAALDLTEAQRDALRGSSGTDTDFRLTYPFSPAFLNVVVDIAGVLQRTRTGLRVLLDLLVKNRETLEVGQLVPVGDLFDVLAESNEPLSDAMKQPFAAARRIYESSLRPMLLAEHKLTEGAELTGAFVNDDRLVKTLLLAALVPNSEPFKNMTAAKLVALNHGLITSPVPGAETTVVVNKLNGWAARTGELQVGGDANNPTVHIVLSEVDTRSILDSVSGVDNPGSRRKLVRDLIAEELGVDPDQLMETTKLLWKGVQRQVDLVFGNIRNAEELDDSSFASNAASWKVVIDFPFDDEGHGPAEDVARVQRLREQHGDWHTVCWIPSFFTADMRAQLGNLVRLNHLLPVAGQASERFREATKDYSAEVRESARLQLEAQQQAARSRLQQALKQAYGLGASHDGVVDSSHGLADHFPSVRDGFTVRPPVASTLRDAFESVVSQALEHTYPAAPDIVAEVRNPELRTVLEVCTEALEQPDRRVPQVPTADRRSMSRIANPLRLGTQSEQAFLLDVTTHWDPHFTRKLSDRQKGGAEGNPTVAELRTWIDEPKAMGLSRELQNLVLLVWAMATDRTFTDHGGPARTGIDSLGDHFELIEQDLPEIDTWVEATQRAASVLGEGHLPTQPSAVGLARLSNLLSAAVGEHGEAATKLVGELESLLALIDAPHAQRIETAKVASSLLDRVGAAGSDLAKLEAFVETDLLPSPEAVGASIKSADAVAGTIADVDTQILASAMTREEGASLVDALRALLEADELASPIVPKLRELYKRARDIVVVTPPPVPPVPPTAGQTVVSERDLDRSAAQKKLKELRKQLESGQLEGDRFDIELTVRADPPNDGDERP